MFLHPSSIQIQTVRVGLVWRRSPSKSLCKKKIDVTIQQIIFKNGDESSWAISIIQPKLPVWKMALLTCWSSASAVGGIFSIFWLIAKINFLPSLTVWASTCFEYSRTTNFSRSWNSELLLLTSVNGSWEKCSKTGVMKLQLVHVCHAVFFAFPLNN